MDIDQLLNERVLELFGPETLELDEEYQADISLQRVHTIHPQQINIKEQLKAQAKYRRKTDQVLVGTDLSNAKYDPSQTDRQC